MDNQDIMRVVQKFNVAIIIFISILLCGCLSSESYNSPIAEKIYTNPQSTFQITYPNDWVLIEMNNTICLTSSPSDGIIQFEKEPPEGNFSSENLQIILDKVYINKISKTPGARIFDKSTIKIANSPAYMVSYTEPPGSIKEITIVTNIDNRFFFLHYLTYEQYFDQNLPKVMKIFNSMKVLDHTGSLKYSPIPTPTQISWKTYSNYGLSFNYSEETPVIEGFEENKAATYDSGKLHFGDSSAIFIAWTKSGGIPTNFDEMYLTNINQIQSGSNRTNINIGTIETTIILGHPVSTVSTKSNYNEKYWKPNTPYNDQYVWWYCPESDRIFFLGYMTTENPILAKKTFMAFLDSFKCH